MTATLKTFGEGRSSFRFSLPEGAPVKLGDIVQIRYPESGRVRGPFIFLFSLSSTRGGEHAYLRHRPGVKGGYPTRSVLEILPHAKETIERLGLQDVENWVITIPLEWIESVPS